MEIAGALDPQPLKNAASQLPSFREGLSKGARYQCAGRTRSPANLGMTHACVEAWRKGGEAVYLPRGFAWSDFVTAHRAREAEIPAAVM